MRITLKNFLCYADETFDFGEQGVSLLTGPSGVGKTSILRGIFFALFGEGNKLQSYGKTSCCVELEFDGLKIIRTKRPNRVVVNDTHEDDSAQEIINKKFGYTFKTSGYIQQNNLSSFIVMSPVEKLLFLETFAFKDVQLGVIKGRCKAHISKCNEELVGVVSQLDMVNKILSETKMPEEVKFPLKCKIKDRELCINNEKIRYKNCSVLINRSLKKIKKLTDEINELKVMEATVKSRKEIQDEMKINVESIRDEIIKNKKYYSGCEELKLAEKNLESFLSMKYINSMEELLEKDFLKLEEMYKQEKSCLVNEKINIEENLWKEYNKEELSSTLSELNNYLSDVEKVELLRKEQKKNYVVEEKHKENKEKLLEYKDDLLVQKELHDKIVFQQDLFSCPKCKSLLKFLNKELILSEDSSGEVCDIDLDTVKKNIKNLQIDIDKLQKLVPVEESKIESSKDIEIEINEIVSFYEDFSTSKEIREDIEYLVTYKKNQQVLENKKINIDRNIREEIFSSSYNSFKAETEKLQKEISQLKVEDCYLDKSIDEEELRNKIISQKKIRDIILSLEKSLNEKNKTIEKQKILLEELSSCHIKKYGSIKNIIDIEKNIQKENEDISIQEKKSKLHKSVIENIELWEKYQNDITNYNIWKTKLKELKKNEIVCKNKYAASTKLKDTILEAESIAMMNIIESINTHARVYLDYFFVENPISVQLQSFKHTKKNIKPMINICIEYKGMEVDMNMLSGGELSRVILAYTLALAEMFNTPLLLLDECTSSLDQDLSSVVFQAIRDNFNGKMTIVIAHQVVTGTFDKTISL